MAKYIERDRLLMNLAEEYDKYNPKLLNDSHIRHGVSLATNIIKNQPAADVAEVRHGKWIRHKKDGAIFADYECSICSAYPTGGIRSYYCPNCGAKMD